MLPPDSPKTTNQILIATSPSEYSQRSPFVSVLQELEYHEYSMHYRLLTIDCANLSFHEGKSTIIIHKDMLEEKQLSAIESIAQ